MGTKMIVAWSLMTAALVGCESPAPAPGASLVSIPTNLIGEQCVVTIQTDPAGSNFETFEGELSQVQDGSIRLLDPTHSVRRIKTTPVFSALPFIGDRFTSVGAASEQLSGVVTISRQAIFAIDAVH